MKNSDVEWNMRPGGMLVGGADGGPGLNLNVLRGPVQYELFVPAQSTFGDVKMAVFRKTGLKPNEQRLLFRGKERDDEEKLVVAGVKNNSKFVLLEDPVSQERKLEEANGVDMSKVSEGVSGSTKEVDKLMERVSALQVPVADGTKVVETESGMSSEMAEAFEAVARIRTEVDKLAERVSALEVAAGSGTKVADKEFDVSTELLMRQLLNLDGIEAEGDAKMQRKAEVRRIQKLVDRVDGLKARNSNPFNASNTVSVTTQWETFDSGMGSLSAPPPPMQSSAQVVQNWEQFD